MITLRNKTLQIDIHPRGAELTRIKNIQHDLDYLWNGDPEYWAKHSPVLFPIVGTLKDNTYQFNGKSYNLSRHGFAREMMFTGVQNNNTASLELTSSEETRDNYPFDFLLRLIYELNDNKLAVRYEVFNQGQTEMFFSIGGHPAFRVPLQEDQVYEDYYLEFDHTETLDRWPLQDGLIKTHPLPLLKNEQVLHLTHDLFASDAIVLKNVKSQHIALRSRGSSHGLSMRISDFPYLGIWAAPGAPFVCIEPWQGIADSVYHDGKLTHKEGTVTLKPGDHWSKSWDATFW